MKLSGINSSYSRQIPNKWFFLQSKRRTLKKMINFGVVTLEWKLLNDSRISCTKCPRTCSSLCLSFLFLRDIE